MFTCNTAEFLVVKETEKGKMAVSLARKAEFPSIFDADSEEETDSDEEYRRNARDDTGPSLIPLQVRLDTAVVA